LYDSKLLSKQCVLLQEENSKIKREKEKLQNTNKELKKSIQSFILQREILKLERSKELDKIKNKKLHENVFVPEKMLLMLFFFYLENLTYLSYKQKGRKSKKYSYSYLSSHINSRQENLEILFHIEKQINNILD
jgi:hypothetical protein